MAIKLHLETYSPAMVTAITGISQFTQRNWRRQGYLPSYDGWAVYELRDLAKFYLVSLMIEAGFAPNQAMELAHEEVVATVVTYAVLAEGSVIDKTAKKVLSANKKRTILQLAEEIAELPKNRAPAGTIFAWGPAIETGGYVSIEHAQQVAYQNDRKPHVLSFIDLSAVGTALADRAGHVAVLEDKAEK